MHPDVLRRQLQPTFAPALGDYPDFALLFESPERQFVFLTGDLIQSWCRETRGALGIQVFEALLARSLAETNWKNLKISVGTGVEWNATKLRTLGECVQMASALFEGTYRGLAPVLGLKPNRRAFERAFTVFAARHPRLPVVKNLLGVSPLDTLAAEKSQRLHDLETETATQEHGLRAADEGLHRQAERLQQTVGELESTRERLEATSRAQSVFIDVVSHQFRTPLSTVRWNAEMLYDETTRKPDVDPAQREAIESIRAKSVYLIETLDRVFGTLEIDTGTLVVNRKPAFLWEIIQNVRDGFEREIKAKGIDFKFVRAKSQVKEIPLDQARIEAVLKIVLGNAIEYAPDKGHVAVDLSPRTVNGLEYLVCSITDDGLGLPADDLPKFFSKFFRSKAAVLKIADGTGLGNYIVKSVIEAHKGWVTVESAGEGKGTTVRLALPLV
jgi:signal transduction histidine kinase